MNPQPKNGKAATAKKPLKTVDSFNFFQGCNTSSQPDWGAGITRFKLIRRRSSRAKD